MPHRRFRRVVECRETAALSHFNLIRMAAGQYMHAQQGRTLLMAFRSGGRINRWRVVQVTRAANGRGRSRLRAGRWSRWCRLCNGLRRRRCRRRGLFFGHLRLCLWLGRHRACRWFWRGGQRFGRLCRGRRRRRRNRRSRFSGRRRHGGFGGRDHLHGNRHGLRNRRQWLRRHTVQQEKTTHMRAQRDDTDQHNVRLAGRWDGYFRQGCSGLVECMCCKARCRSVLADLLRRTSG